MKEILLEEYKTLKAEQLSRIKHRDNIIYVLLGAVGTLFSFAIIHKVYYVAAIVPMISFVLCWMYLSNDRKISEIGNYISEDLAKELGDDEKIFLWETKRKGYSGRKVRKLIQFVVEMIVFSLPAAIGLIAAQFQPNGNAVFIIDFIFVSWIVVLFIYHYSDNKITHEEVWHSDYTCNRPYFSI